MTELLISLEINPEKINKEKFEMIENIEGKRNPRLQRLKYKGNGDIPEKSVQKMMLFIGLRS